MTIRTIGGSQRVLVDSLNELGSASHMLSAPAQSFAVRTVSGN
jgi:hypothetical protein